MFHELPISAEAMINSAREYRRAVVLVYGQTGSGKSILARALLRSRVNELGPAAVGLVVDTLREYYDLPAIAPESLSNYLTLDTNHGGRIARVLVHDEADFDALAVTLAESYRRGRLGPVVLMVDEVSFWSSPGRSTPGLSRLIRYGRHWRVDLIGVARRPAETSRELSSQVNDIYIIGGIVEPRDLAYMRATMPADALTKIASLERFHYLRYRTDGTYAVGRPVKIL